MSALLSSFVIYSEPLVSVVVPVYHVEPWLRQCLDSVMGQTYTNLEVILVDDGSKDKCSEFCDEYALLDSRFQVIHQENKGLGNARNTGMDLANGKYIIFLDSDDYWQPNTVEKCCRTAEDHQLEVVVFSAEVFFDGAKPDDYLEYKHTVQNGIVKSGLAGLKTDKKYKEYYAQACLRFYLLSYLKENHLQFDEGIIHEDESFSFLTCLQAERLMYLGDKLYIRRFREGSIMMTPDPLRSARGFCTAMETLSRYSKEAGFSGEKLQLCIDWMRSFASTVFSMYRKAKRSGNRTESGKILETATNTFQTIRNSRQNFSLRLRIIINSFVVGYSCWLLKRGIKKVLKCVGVYRLK